MKNLSAPGSALIFACMLALLAGNSWGAPAEWCFPEIDDSQPQYLVAYGSLLHDRFREKKLEATDVDLPVWVNGYKRGWITRLPGGNKTRLGVTREDGKQFNGALISLSKSKIKSIDRHEAGLCRVKVDRKLLMPMAKQAMPDKGQFWLYETLKAQAKKPAGDYPMLLSEVDTFLTGCIEQGEQFGLKTFPQQCVDSTLGWSVHWRNDRSRPVSAKLVQSRRTQVDKLLEKLEGGLYEMIRAE